MGMASELDCWMQWIENSMADAAFDMSVIDDFDDFIGGTDLSIDQWFIRFALCSRCENLIYFSTFLLCN